MSPTLLSVANSPHRLRIPLFRFVSKHLSTFSTASLIFRAALSSKPHRLFFLLLFLFSSAIESLQPIKQVLSSLNLSPEGKYQHRLDAKKRLGLFRKCCTQAFFNLQTVGCLFRTSTRLHRSVLVYLHGCCIRGCLSIASCEQRIRRPRLGQLFLSFKVDPESRSPKPSDAIKLSSFCNIPAQDCQLRSLTLTCNSFHHPRSLSDNSPRPIGKVDRTSCRSQAETPSSSLVVSNVPDSNLYVTIELAGQYEAHANSGTIPQCVRHNFIHDHYGTIH